MRLAVVGEIDARGEHVHRAELVESMTNFSYDAARPPSSQPAACSTKLAPASTVGSRVCALS